MRKPIMLGELGVGIKHEALSLNETGREKARTGHASIKQNAQVSRHKHVW